MFVILAEKIQKSSQLVRVAIFFHHFQVDFELTVTLRSSGHILWQWKCFVCLLETTIYINWFHFGACSLLESFKNAKFNADLFVSLNRGQKVPFGCHGPLTRSMRPTLKNFIPEIDSNSQNGSQKRSNASNSRIFISQLDAKCKLLHPKIFVAPRTARQFAWCGHPLHRKSLINNSFIEVSI